MFRWIILAVLIAALSISKSYRRRAQLATGTIPRSREGGAAMAARGLIALPLFFSIFAYVIDPNWMAWSAFALPLWLRWTCAATAALTVPGTWWVFRNIGSNVSETVLTKDNHELVTTGPYRWVRHPLYTVSLIMIVSIGIMAANWFILALSGIAVVLVRSLVIPREESELLAKFGDDYEKYQAHTGRIVPRLG